MSSIYKKWTNAVKQLKDAQDDFDGLCDAVGNESTAAWTTLEEELQSERADDITVMDSFDVSNDVQVTSLNFLMASWRRFVSSLREARVAFVCIRSLARAWTDAVQ